LSEASEGAGSQGRSSAFAEAPEKSFAELRIQISSGNRNPQGDAVEAEEQAAAGRQLSPEAVTEQSAGYETADDPCTKNFGSSQKRYARSRDANAEAARRNAPSNGS